MPPSSTNVKVTHQLEEGQPYVFLVVDRKHAIGVPSSEARDIARQMILCAAEAESEARARLPGNRWKP